MAEQIQISGKNLGQLALPDGCERCQWLMIRLQHKVPYSIFPGIFSSIDAYTKNMVHGWFDRHQQRPGWLNGLGDIRAYVNPPSHHKFRFRDEKRNILLTGAPDAIFSMADGSYVIADYKTAKFTNAQDVLLPMYETQLNVYKIIAERANLFAPISGLGLIYFEPVTDRGAICDENCRGNGISMGLSAYVKSIQASSESIEALLDRLRHLAGQSTAPRSREKCKDCERVGNLLRALS